MQELLTLKNIEDAHERLRDVAFHTELVPARMLSKPGLEVFIKTESLQHTGSFKLRGAYNKIAVLSAAERQKGVLAASAGNHAQGVALAARAYGVKATLVMPSGAPLQKVMATRGLGAEVVLTGASFDEAYAYALELQKQTGATFVHPFDDLEVIAGQGTIGLEILKDMPDTDAIIVPVGGGGLAAGIAVAAKAIAPHIKVIGVEAKGADCMKRSVDAGKLVTLEQVNTMADGIAVKTPGANTFALCREYLDEIITVDEEEIANAILMLLEKSKIVSEGAGAVGVAALLHNKLQLSGKVVVVLSGGNIDVNMLSRVIERGLIKAGRRVNISTIVEDRPGKLRLLLEQVSNIGANILSIQHDRTREDVPLGRARILMTLETQDDAHIAQMMVMLAQNGYAVERCDLI